MIVFNVAKGTITINGETYANCYSGFGEGVNNSVFEALKNVGPIPRGVYDIGPWHNEATIGPCVASLTPVDIAAALGRTDLYWHGDTYTHNHTASHGCLISPSCVRIIARGSGEKQLTVE